MNTERDLWLAKQIIEERLREAATTRLIRSSQAHLVASDAKWSVPLRYWLRRLAIMPQKPV